MKILLLENIHEVAKQQLKCQGFEVDLLSGALTEDELITKLQSYQAVGIRSKTQITDKVLEGAKHLRAIGTFCIGTNQVALQTAAKLGIPVFNAPYANTRSVAELVISQIIALARRMVHLSYLAKSGVWNKSATSSYEVRGKTLGIVGYGHIGSQVSVLAEAMGLNVLYYDVVKKLPLGNSHPVESLSDLLQQSDFVSLHVPATAQTKNMMNATQLDLMRRGSFLINASRGSVVDIEALTLRLKEGLIGGAAIDVFPVEPKNNTEPFCSPLQEVDNVILTPHIGGSTEEAQESIGREVSDSLTAYLKTGATSQSVNFPKAELPTHDGSLRVLNVHKNVPGVLSNINKIVSETGININSQYLATDSDIGYLIMDVDKSDAQNLHDAIETLPNSIRTFLLH